MIESKVALEATDGKLAPLVRGDEEWCGSYWDEADTDQQVSRPTYIVIGRGAPDDKLQKIVLRYGYTLEQLKAFRDGPILNETDVIHG